ncbi:MAG: DUF3854 domain-containing protein [Chloroflexota bacterium]|nr:DUF3854 domain-containing protein [Chloroflexota bacterium]
MQPAASDAADGPVFSSAIPDLLADHYRQLRASAISDEVIRERGYRTAMGKTLLKELGFASSQQRAQALVVPLHGVDGAAAGCQVRPDHPRKDNRGRIVKYETPAGSAGRLDVPPHCRDSLADPSVPILVTEGAKKADALASAGACALNISGVWNWKARNRFGGVTVSAELDYVAWKGPHGPRQAYLAFDSDVVEKEGVRAALERLAAHLRRRGAAVSLVRLPPGPEGAKVGVDDFLALGHTLSDVYSLAKPMEEEPTPENAMAQRSRDIVADMAARGSFVSAEGRRYYFDELTRALCEIGDFGFKVIANARYGVNASERFYNYLLQDVEVYAHLKGESATVRQHSHYDPDSNQALIDGGNGRVYVLDGKKVSLARNGDHGVLFLPVPDYEAWEYEPGSQGAIESAVLGRLNFVPGGEVVYTPDEQRLLFLCWWIGLYFETVQPTKAIPLALGPKGSGKTSAFRRVGKALFGRRFEVTPIEREEDYTAAITNSPFVVFDNVDGRLKWLNDALARTATGHAVRRRKLYTTNELETFWPRAFVALTARTPRFRRDDVSERLLLFRMERLPSFGSEYQEMARVLDSRNAVLSELADAVNATIRTPRPSSIPGTVRLADFAAVAMRIATALGVSSRMESILRRLPTDQAAYAVEEDALYHVLDSWLSGTGPGGAPNEGRWVTTTALLGELQAIADVDGVRLGIEGAQSLGRRIQLTQDTLTNYFVIERDCTRRSSTWRFTRRQA